MKIKLGIGASVSYFISFLLILYGFYKMLVYRNSESYYSESVNAYVGGDAYNYIINANYATGYFTLAIFFAIIGMTFILSYFLVKDKPNIEKVSNDINM